MTPWDSAAGTLIAMVPIGLIFLGIKIYEGNNATHGQEQFGIFLMLLGLGFAAWIVFYMASYP